MARPVRIPAQQPDEWSDETRAELDAVVPTARYRPVHLPAVIAHHPTFLAPYLTWAKAVALRGVLDARVNAMLALRTAHNCGSQFEWGVHAETAVARAGLGPEEVAAVADGPASTTWLPGDAALLRAADELHATHTVSDDTWAELAAHHDEAALLEIVFVVGHYTMLSMVANSAGVPPEEHWAPLGEAPGGSPA